MATATGTVNTAVPGSYTIRYNVSDAAGNAAIAVSRTVIVAGQTPPVVNAPAALTLTAPTSNGIAATDPAVTAFLNGASATDNVGVIGSISNDAPALLTIGLHAITFSATDAAGNQGSATSGLTVLAPAQGVTTVTYQLTAGWNLIGFPVNMGPTGLADFLAAAPDVSKIWTLQGGVWRSYIRGLPGFLNTLQSLLPNQGYWVKVAVGVNLVVSISGTPITTSPVLQPAGWNLIAVPATISNVATYIAATGATEIWGFNQGTWCSYNSAMPAFLNCLTAMQPETGYYLKMP